MNETDMTAVAPLVALGDTEAAQCADGFCALPPVPATETGPEISPEISLEISPEISPEISRAQTGTGE